MHFLEFPYTLRSNSLYNPYQFTSYSQFSMKFKQFYFTVFFLLTFLSLSSQLKAQYGYEVFVAGYSQKVPVSYFKGLPVAEKFSYGQIHSYYLTGFKTKEEADKAQANAISLGFKDARVENIADKASGCCYGYQPPVALAEDLKKIHNIFFDFDKADLKADGINQLNLLAKIMKENPSYTVEVHAHTDAKGDNAYNDALAVRRENAAMNYLVKKGIARSRMSGKEFGENSPIAKNEINGKDTPEGRQLNRRVELVVKDGNQVLNVVEEIKVPDALKQ